MEKLIQKTITIPFTISPNLIFLAIMLSIIREVISPCSTGCMGCLCTTCANALDCGACVDGFGVAVASVPKICQACPANCFRCSTNNAQCTNCNLGYGVMPNGQCGACASTFCANCQTSYTYCFQCRVANGVGINSGSCINCAIANCRDCHYNALICNGCSQRFGFTINSTCQLCQVENCLQCYANISDCTACELGYFFVNGNCTACTPDCARCLNETACQECIDGYGIVIADATCLPCVDSNCFKCSFDRTFCNQCIISYGLSGGICIPCVNNRCKDCNANASICVECIAGYVQPRTGCIPCSSPCSTCITTTTACTSCIENYVIVMFSCVACPDLLVFCIACQNSTVCEQCAPGYFALTPSICNLCPNNCTLCFMNVNYNLPQCTQCSAGSQLSNDLPPLCQELCGDSSTSSHPCDNPKNVPYDGCNNYCEVEDGFECYVDTLGNTVCSYNETLHIEFVSAVRTPDTNIFTFSFTVFPPLYIFSQLSSSQLQQIFTFNTSSLQVISMTFDSQSQTLIIESSVTQTLLINSTISITFNPQNSSISQFYASIDSICPFTIPYSLYFYSQFGLLFVKIGMFLCYAIVGLSWLVWVFGAWGKKLAGVQAMIVMQYCWLPLLFTSCQFSIQFQEVFPLKFSTIYSISIIKENQIASKNSPFFNEFKVSQGYLSNNFNLQLILMLLFLIPIIITSVRLKKVVEQAKKKRDWKSQEQKQSTEKQIEKYINQNQFAYSTFMYVCMSFFVYFVFCSAIFFKYGTVTDISSIVVFALGFLLYLFIYIQMFRDPSCFSYFRYSFKIANLAMNHYLILPACLLVSTVLLSILQVFSYIGGIPLLLIMIYTLAYRPYNQFKQNLRSSFNFLVMLSFIGYMVYIEIVSREQLSSNFSIGILIGNLGLLLIVILWALIYSIYSYCYENCVQSQQEKQEGKETTQKKVRFKILEELGIVNLKKNVKIIEEDTTLREVFQKDMNHSILDISNNLRELYHKQRAGLNDSDSERAIIKAQNIQESDNNFHKKNRKLLQNSEMGTKICKQKRDNGIIKNYETRSFINKLESNQQKEQLERKLKQVIKTQKQQSTEVNKSQLVKQILTQQNKFIKFRSALEVVYEQMYKQDQNDQLFVDEFDKIYVPKAAPPPPQQNNTDQK